ncbi:hypothetical protein KBD68_04530 [Candidatus Woesebacteria bacterium]|nr:hypothetical protein [Candidatus Woesebacteria bacterium]
MFERVELAPVQTPSAVESALNKVINSAEHIESRPEFEIARDLSGRVFETIAHETVQARQPEYRRLLSPDETFRIFAKSHPHDAVMSDSFGPKGIKGISVPDGMLYDLRWQEEKNRGLVKLYEYTLTKPSSFMDYVHKKEHAFRIMRNLYGSILSNADLVFVIPAAYSVELPLKFRKNSRIETVSVSPAEIRKVTTEYLHRVNFML